MTTLAHLRYDEPTASMLADTEAPRLGEVTSASSLWDLSGAACADSDQEWVPAFEQPAVPREMRSLCQECPVRAACLQWALDHDEAGYWAGTTRADRAAMRTSGDISLQTADQLQDARDLPALHAPGEGDYKWYRRQCRCMECRRANAEKRAEERAARAAREMIAA